MTYPGIQNKGVYERHINATLDGLNMTTLLFMHNGDQLSDNNTIKRIQSNYPEQECLVTCLEMERCDAIQAVYENDEIDIIQLMKNVKWCALLEVDLRQANITYESGPCDESYGSTTAFGYIETFLPAAYHNELKNDYLTYWMTIIMKGTK